MLLLASVRVFFVFLPDTVKKHKKRPREYGLILLPLRVASGHSASDFLFFGAIR